MKASAEYIKRDSKDFYLIELSFTYWFPFREGDKWFCRLWKKDWIGCIRRGEKECGWAYGRNKFEAYRGALKDLNSIKNKNDNDN